jgi:hypothetical protein
MLAIQEFLGSGKTLEDLEKLYGIRLSDIRSITT